METSSLLIEGDGRLISLVPILSGRLPDNKHFIWILKSFYDGNHFFVSYWPMLKNSYCNRNWYFKKPSKPKRDIWIGECANANRFYQTKAKIKKDKSKIKSNKDHFIFFVHSVRNRITISNLTNNQRARRPEKNIIEHDIQTDGKKYGVLSVQLILSY